MTAGHRVGTLVLASAASLCAIRAGDALPPAPPSGSKAFVVSIDIYRAQIAAGDKAEFRIAGTVSRSTSKSEGGGAAGSPARCSLAFGEADLALKGLALHAASGGWTWNGKPEPPAGTGADKLAAPRIHALAGQQFEVFIGSELPIQYFEKRPDGLFELKELKEWTGIKFRGAVEPSGEKEAVIRDLDCQVRTVGARAPLEGVTLDVGPPMVTAHEVATTVKVPLDSYSGIAFDSDSQGFLLIKVKVSAAPPAEKREGGAPPAPAR